MSRKRKSDQPSTETVAEQPSADGGTAVAELPAAEPPVAEPKAEGQSFAEKVGQKKWTPAPDPFGIAKDNLAGVRLFASEHDRQMAIKFGDGSPKDKPSQKVIDKMHDAGWEWKSAHRIWALPFTPESASRTHVVAERFYQELCQMIRQEKGIDAATPEF
jgi:hypothetical protein